MAAPDSDVEAVRQVLERLAGGGIVSREESRRALDGFERLSPKLVPTETVHAWCRCGHEHSTWTATGLPVPECHWLFCGCKRFILWGPTPPDAETKARLHRKTEQQRAAWRPKSGK